MKEVSRRSFMGGTAAAVAVTGVTAAEAATLTSQTGSDFLLVFLEASPDCDERLCVEDLNAVMEIVEATIDPAIDPGKKRVGVFQLPPGMSAKVIGGSDGAIRKLKKVVVAQSQ